MSVFAPVPAEAATAATPLTVTECDILASSPFDKDRVTEGVPSKKVDASQAKEACKRAIAEQPSVARFYYQYARALVKAGETDKAAQMCNKAAEMDYTAGKTCSAMSRALLGVFTNTSKEADNVSAAKMFNEAADQGDPLAALYMGMFYRDGKGVPKNSAYASKYLALSMPTLQSFANDGEAWAQQNLGWMYESGIGVPRDQELARQWYQKAAAQGSEYASTALNRLPLATGSVDTSAQLRHPANSLSGRSSQQAPRVSESDGALKTGGSLDGVWVADHASCPVRDCDSTLLISEELELYYLRWPNQHANFLVPSASNSNTVKLGFQQENMVTNSRASSFLISPAGDAKLRMHFMNAAAYPKEGDIVFVRRSESASLLIEAQKVAEAGRFSFVNASQSTNIRSLGSFDFTNNEEAVQLAQAFHNMLSLAGSPKNPFWFTDGEGNAQLQIYFDAAGRPSRVFNNAVHAQQQAQEKKRKEEEENDRVRARVLALSSFMKNMEVEQVSNIGALSVNPFIAKGKVVALPAGFVNMVSEDEGLFGSPRSGGYGKVILVSEMPTTRFTSAEDVLLAGRVLGNKVWRSPAGEMMLPHLKYVGALPGEYEKSELFLALELP